MITLRNIFFGFTLLISPSVYSSEIIPSIIFYFFQGSEPSHLDKVLRAYNDSSSEHIFIAAHRGGKEFDSIDNAPGNSIPNIANAVNRGFDLYESDIEILGDSTLIAFHDNHFNSLTNSTINNDLLDNATLSYAKSLFLLFEDGTVSNQRIPTLEELLVAGKDKLMFKFDLKSGTFGSATLKRIFDTVISTKTEKQVLIRGGAYVLDVAKNNNYNTQMIMRRYNSAPTVSDINTLVYNYDIKAISIPNGASNEVISAANAAGLIVEVHDLQGANIDDYQNDISDKINQGVRQFHSFKPSVLKAYLKTNGHREF